ncbi:MAG: alpha/beta hydrolase [Bifidobacteriaceae bacterium]|nr:alpha/beta hydrolase [Bifidobacteriaceae bacterium]
MTAPQIARNLPYGPDPRHKLDLYRPTAAARAVIVDIHGGGWWTGDKSSETALASALAEAGYLVAAPNYRLADGGARLNLYPTQIEDIGSVLAWLEGTGLAEDSSRIGVVGTSSGGNLAAEAAVRYGVPAASWSGLLNLDGFLADHPGVTPTRMDISTETPAEQIDQTGANDSYYAWLVGNLLGGDLSQATAATPIHRVGAKTGPMFLAGSLNELVPPKEVALMAFSLIGAGVSVETMVLRGTRHAQAYLSDALPGTLAFLRRYLG